MMVRDDKGYGPWHVSVPTPLCGVNLDIFRADTREADWVADMGEPVCSDCLYELKQLVDMAAVLGVTMPGEFGDEVDRDTDLDDTLY